MRCLTFSCSTSNILWFCTGLWCYSHLHVQMLRGTLLVWQIYLNLKESKENVQLMLQQNVALYVAVYMRSR
jgi:hypothetical protein